MEQRYEVINKEVLIPKNKALVIIEFSNFETSQKTFLFAGCTRNYLKDHFSDSIDEFLKFLVNKWVTKMDIVFDKKIHIDTYADTESGIKNIESFLIEQSRVYVKK